MYRKHKELQSSIWLMSRFTVNIETTYFSLPCLLGEKCLNQEGNKIQQNNKIRHILGCHIKIDRLIIFLLIKFYAFWIKSSLVMLLKKVDIFKSAVIFVENDNKMVNISL